jgi:hypothetical protein
MNLFVGMSTVGIPTVDGWKNERKERRRGCQKSDLVELWKSVCLRNPPRFFFVNILRVPMQRETDVEGACTQCLLPLLVAIRNKIRGKSKKRPKRPTTSTTTVSGVQVSNLTTRTITQINCHPQKRKPLCRDPIRTT